MNLANNGINAHIFELFDVSASIKRLLRQEDTEELPNWRIGTTEDLVDACSQFGDQPHFSAWVLKSGHAAEAVKHHYVTKIGLEAAPGQQVNLGKQAYLYVFRKP